MEFIVIAEQLWYILYAALFGFFACLLYFCIKILRMTVGVTPINISKIKYLNFIGRFSIKKLKIGAKFSRFLFIHVLDVLYLVFVSVSFCVFVFYFNHGRIRWYLLFSAMLGFLAFYFSIGKIIILLSRYIVYIIKSFTNLIIYAIIDLVMIIFKPISLTFGKMRLLIRHRSEYERLKKYIFIKEEIHGT